MRAWQKTCLPASSAEIVTAECMYGGVPIQIMSMSGSATSSGQFFIGVAPGTFSLQNFSELSYAELETATISTSGCFLRPGKWRVRTILPAPTIPIRSFWLFLCIGLRAIAILQTRLAVVRAKFDREEQWRVQRQNIGRGGSPEPPMAIEVNRLYLMADEQTIRLTRARRHGSLRGFF